MVIKKVFSNALSAAILSALLAAGISGCAAFSPPVWEQVTLETGIAAIDPNICIREGKTAQLVTDISGIDLTRPGTYILEFTDGRSTWQTRLQLTDTTAPTATAVAQTIYSNQTLQPEDFVADVCDLTPVEIRFAQVPDFTRGGDHTVHILLTDTSGNTATIDAPLTVLVDDVYPVFSPMKPLKVNKGQTVSYRKGISVTDDRDGPLSFSVDSSAVDLEQPGVYVIRYFATDSSGNTAIAERTVEVCASVVVNQELVDALAQQVLSKILTEEMTPHEKPETVYNYVRKNMHYQSSSDTELLEGAYRALTRHNGDCFNYFAITKVLLDNCGIDNLPVQRDSDRSTHYWLLVNVGTGWYHLDTLAPYAQYPFKCFMKTDAQVEAYSRSRTDGKTDYYKFDGSLYPQRATENYKAP